MTENEEKIKEEKGVSRWRSKAISPQTQIASYKLTQQCDRALAAVVAVI